MAKKHVRGQTLKQRGDKEATAFNDGDKPKVRKREKPGSIKYAVDFSHGLGNCSCGNTIGQIGYRNSAGVNLCYACARGLNV